MNVAKYAAAIIADESRQAVAAALIGNGALSGATLEPMTDDANFATRKDGHVVLDARNIDQWGRTHAR